MTKEKVIIVILRLSIASVFLYAAIAATLEPGNWIGYLPQMLRNIFLANQLLIGFSFFEFILAVWILSGWKALYSSVISALTLIGIIFANLGAIDIVFRDIAIFFSSIALVIASYKTVKR